MKKIFICLVLTSGFMLPAYENDADEENSKNFQFEATVLGEGLERSGTYLIALTNLGNGSEVKDGTYYADNLSEELKKAGLKIRLNCRVTGNDELHTDKGTGPAFEHLFVIDGEVL